ncbi:MAG: hypothetical protein LBT13_04135 [Treponema sp.]|jgi:hypothetical protein|nr:hypothetical protein [Treponema sp.]
MNVLVTNDDGIDGEGLLRFAGCLRTRQDYVPRRPIAPGFPIVYLFYRGLSG